MPLAADRRRSARPPRPRVQIRLHHRSLSLVAHQFHVVVRMLPCMICLFRSISSKGIIAVGVIPGNYMVLVRGVDGAKTPLSRISDTSAVGTIVATWCAALILHQKSPADIHVESWSLRHASCRSTYYNTQRS